MTGHLLRVSPAELHTYLADSTQLEDRIYRNASKDRALEEIDKTWDGIIFLLTGQSFAQADHPLTRVLFSGQL